MCYVAKMCLSFVRAENKKGKLQCVLSPLLHFTLAMAYSPSFVFAASP